MYICPICQRQFNNEEGVTKHSLRCWREHNPNHKSKSAPHGEDIVERKVNNELFEFFEGLPVVCKK